MEEDLRSVRSEYDYGSKKKFVDVLGNISATQQLKKLRAQHEIQNASNPGGLGSVKSSQFSKASYKSHISKVSGRSLAMAGRVKKTDAARDEKNSSPIPEEDPNDDEELEARPEDFVNCNTCMKKLSEDEKIINARFVNEAMAASRDISVFPICISCNFE